MSLDPPEDLDAEIGNVDPTGDGPGGDETAPPPDYGDGPKDADEGNNDATDNDGGALVTPTTGGIDEFPGKQAGPPDLSDSSGNPDDDPDTEALADAEEREEVPGELVTSSKGTFADHDGDDLPDAAFHDAAGEPVPDIPAPITPNTPTDEAQRRVNYERFINDSAERFANEARAAFIEHNLAGRTVEFKILDDAGEEWEPEGDDNPGYAEGPGGIDTVNDPSRSS